MIPTMKIAVASQNFRTVTAHAGKTRRFLVFQAAAGAPVVEAERIDLPMGMAMHDFHGDGEHPLYAVNVIIVGSAGAGFINRLAAHGVEVALTSETDPSAAVGHYLAGTLPPAAPHEHHHH